ncbi:LOW QUALITY PROTEIN: coiled-coil domain-containing protein 158 [Ara ararauna]
MTFASAVKFICLSDGACPFLSNQNVLASSILSTVVKSSACSSTTSSPPNNVFCSKCEIHTDSEKENLSGAGKEHMENVLEEYSQKGRDTQKRLNETTELHEQQKSNLRLIIADLQTKLMEVQLERDALQDARQKEFQSQENIKIHLKTTIQKLEAASHLQEEMLREADSQTEHLEKMVHSHEKELLELHGILLDYEDSTGRKLCDHENITVQHMHSLSTGLADMLQDLDSEVSYLKEKVVLVCEESYTFLSKMFMFCIFKRYFYWIYCQNLTTCNWFHSLRWQQKEGNCTLKSTVLSVSSVCISIVICLQQVEEELESLKKDSQTQKKLLQQHQNRIEQLVSEHEQEVAALNDKHSAHSCANSMESQMEIIQQQTRNQNSVHVHQVSHLESTVSQLRSELQEAKRIYEDKIKDLEKQLHLSRSEVAEAQTEQDQSSQVFGYLNNHTYQLLLELQKKEIKLSQEKEQNKQIWDQNTDSSITIDHLRRQLDNKTKQLHVCMENTAKEMRTEWQRQMEHQMAAIKEKNESIGRISSLTVQLESTKETLHKVKEDLAAKQINLEIAGKTVSNLTACLQEKERALEVTSEEIKKLHSQLRSRMQEIQHLKNEEDRFHYVQSERETLKLQMSEKEKLEIFQKQIDNMTQIVGQHSRAAGAMEVEKSQLIKEIDDWKLKVEELKIVKDEKETRIHEMEVRLSELELEKVKLVNTCTERLHALNDTKLEKDQLMNEFEASREGFEDLKRGYQDKIKEMENTANRLKMQLKSAQAELEQTRTALKTMEGSDGNALKVAVGMQKQITAKRGQMDVLQSKIKFLEEAMTNTAKEKHYLREKNSKLGQELSYITAENTRIAGELEILRSQEKLLKAKISKMETALDKASLQFAECQCIIQCQEQEAMHFRLQHTLDMSSKPDILKEESLQDLKRILQELTSSGNDIRSVDLGKDGSNGGRKSPLATMETAAKDSVTENSMEKDTCGWDPLCFHTADLQSQDVTPPFTSLGGASIFSPVSDYTSAHKVSQEQRHREKSPVHLLLTAPPDDLAAGSSASPQRRPSTQKVCSPKGAATVPHITSQPMKNSKDTHRRPQNKMESLQNLVRPLKIKNQDTSPVIRTHEVKTEKAKEKQKKLSKGQHLVH